LRGENYTETARRSSQRCDRWSRGTVCFEHGEECKYHRVSARRPNFERSARRA